MSEAIISCASVHDWATSSALHFAVAVAYSPGAYRSWGKSSSNAEGTTCIVFSIGQPHTISATYGYHALTGLPCGAWLLAWNKESSVDAHFYGQANVAKNLLSPRRCGSKNDLDRI